MTDSPVTLGIDFGTSHTVAVLGRGRVDTLLFDSSPLLPSGVFAEPGGRLLVGRDAQRSARLDPAAYEPNPKRRIDETALLLGTEEVPVVQAVAAVLSRVRTEAVRVLGHEPARVMLTHPAGWAGRRRSLLLEAATTAGLPAAVLVSEPTAAAAYFTGVLGRQVPPGNAVVVYDFGGGTFDISVVRLLFVMNVFAVIIALDGMTSHDYPVVASGLGATAALNLGALGVWSRALIQGRR